MSIKKFNEFINEAYLKGGRQPLYHYTSDYNITKILSDDLLKISSVARPRGTKAICLTRNPYYTLDGNVKNSPRIVLDYDKLIRDGYRSYPVDEIGIAAISSNKDRNLIKSNFKEVKSGTRGTKHGLDLPKTPQLETEFEERIYKDIKNIGNYIISIEFSKSPNSINEIRSYLNKYPHIIINIYDSENRHKVTDITAEIFRDERVKSLYP